MSSGAATGTPGASVTSRRLTGVTAVAALGLAAGGTAGPLLAADLAGPHAAGWPVAALTAGSALTAPLLTGVSSRRDRLSALRLGHAVAALGAAVAVMAASCGSFWLLLASTVALGGGNTAIFLARYAAVALSPTSRPGRAMSPVLTATALGATASPLLLGPTATVAGALGLPRPAGFYLLATGTYTLAAALLPAAGASTPVPVGPSIPVRPPRRAAAGALDRSALVAVGALAATSLLMVGVMSVAPVHLVDHGTSDTTVGLIVAAHVAAMFGPSPLTGRLADRVGPTVTVLAGLLLLTGVGGASALIEHATTAQTTVGLLVLGLGWNLGLVGGSALLTQAARSGSGPRLEALGEIAMGAGAAVSAPLAALAVVSGLTTLWLAEALIAASAAAVLGILTATARHPPSR